MGDVTYVTSELSGAVEGRRRPLSLSYSQHDADIFSPPTHILTSSLAVINRTVCGQISPTLVQRTVFGSGSSLAKLSVWKGSGQRTHSSTVRLKRERGFLWLQKSPFFPRPFRELLGVTFLPNRGTLLGNFFLGRTEIISRLIYRPQLQFCVCLKRELSQMSWLYFHIQKWVIIMEFWTK